MQLRKPSYPEVLSTLAVFISLGGSAVAVTRITGKDVTNGSLTGRDLKDHSVGAADLKKGTLPPGTRRALRDAGYTKLVTRVNTPQVVDSEVASASVACQAGEVVVGGGVQTGNPPPPSDANVEPIPVVIMRSSPDGGDGQVSHSWQGQVRYTRQDPNQEIHTPRVSVICAS